MLPFQMLLEKKPTISALLMSVKASKSAFDQSHVRKRSDLWLPGGSKPLCGFQVHKRRSGSVSPQRSQSPKFYLPPQVSDPLGHLGGSLDLSGRLERSHTRVSIHHSMEFTAVHQVPTAPSPPKCQHPRHPGRGAGRTLDTDAHRPPSGQGQVGGRWQREGGLTGWQGGGRPRKAPQQRRPKGEGENTVTRSWGQWTPGLSESLGVGRRPWRRRSEVVGVWTELPQARRRAFCRWAGAGRGVPEGQPSWGRAERPSDSFRAERRPALSLWLCLPYTPQLHRTQQEAPTCQSSRYQASLKLLQTQEGRQAGARPTSSTQALTRARTHMPTDTHAHLSAPCPLVRPG